MIEGIVGKEGQQGMLTESHQITTQITTQIRHNQDNNRDNNDTHKATHNDTHNDTHNQYYYNNGNRATIEEVRKGRGKDMRRPFVCSNDVNIPQT